MSNDDGIEKRTLAEASARADKAISNSWGNVAHMQDQTSDARSWLRHLIGYESCADDLLILMAEQHLTMLSMALRMAEEETKK